MITTLGFVLAFLAAVIAGLINALAGGGTLISFPALNFIGVPALAANMTNTVALLPGYLGATFAQRKDLKGQERRLLFFIPVGIIGGIIGGLLLLASGEKLFQQIVPFLILLACALLAVQEPVRAWLVRRAAQKGTTQGSEASALIPIGLAAIYGGYFGAGVSVIFLAVLALVLDDSLTRLNALKQTISFSANLAAAIYFAFSGTVVWTVALVMAGGALIGGNLGGRLAGRIKPSTLRWVVVCIGVVVSIIYLVR
jgi:uncharacterized membrane protein YfcA